MQCFPGDMTPEIERLEADGFRTANLSLCTHTGTHMDAPAHFVAGGKTIEQLDSARFFGPAALIEMRAPEDLSRVPAGTERLLIHDLGYGGLREADAQRLLAAGVRLIGTNNLSIAAEEVSSAVHTRLLESEVLLLEGLWLEGLSEGAYELIALPLRLVGAEGAPARAFVRAME